MTEQKTNYGLDTNIVLVADMHELVEPNKEARAILENLNGRTPSYRELEDVYNNSVDPLVKIVESNKSPLNVISPSYIVSLGDMVVNRVNFGTGTEKSIIGKLGKKARELNIPQHEYIADNFKEHLGEIEEWAYRNSFWTEKRFQKIAGISSSCKFPVFIHLNGNADTLSSYVTREILNANFKSPNEIFENYFRWETDKLFTKDKPKMISFDEKSLTSEGWCIEPPDMDFDSDEIDYKWVKHDSSELRNIQSDLQALLIPHTLEWDAQTVEVEGLLKESKLTPGETMLLIHEPLSYDPFTKTQNIEGMETYKKALSLMPEDTVVVHGHTHAKNLVKYKFEGHTVYQVPPNVGVNLSNLR